MTALALILVLVAAVLHALWNLAAKRAGGGLPFIFLAGLMINGLYAPVLLGYAWLHRPAFSWGAAGVIAVSGVLKTAYAIFLQRGYRAGDFSLIYPLARGTGPLLATLFAILWLGERPTALGAAGGLLIVVSIFFLTGGERWWRTRRPPTLAGAAPPAAPPDGRNAALAVRYGVLTGCFIAAYTVWDRYGVATWRIHPVVFDGGTAVLMLVLLAPFGWRRRDEVRREWRLHRREAAIMAVLSPLGYVLVLTAMTFTPVSYVAPAREISILIGAYLGGRLLKENNTPRRLGAAAGMVVGLAALALG